MKKAEEEWRCLAVRMFHTNKKRTSAKFAAKWRLAVAEFCDSEDGKAAAQTLMELSSSPDHHLLGLQVAADCLLEKGPLLCKLFNAVAPLGPQAVIAYFTAAIPGCAQDDLYQLLLQLLSEVILSGALSASLLPSLCSAGLANPMTLYATQQLAEDVLAHIASKQ
eukprot:gnl/Hemi2/20669_TR6850_c0_g1_i1.p1 gnl/Hemi2/20669_TR6850_c0_g1~~gnl/Hemi2/20669_TR6850_c0_g1_i1.p1  ORF type:complete len:165 (+),score=53.79 gnl/Hemi2/20669_TR6850_c0_g1_i1:204-698(+)